MPRAVAASLSLLLAVAVGVATLWLSDLVHAPGPAPFQQGVGFAAMSERPFALEGGFPHRILAPLLAHGLGLGSARYALFAQGCSAALLAVVFWFSRRRGAAVVDAALITLAIACTGAVQAYKVLVGTSDPVSFLLLVLALGFVRNAPLFWACNLASAFCHEMLFFFVPWLLWERRRAGARLWIDVAGLAAVSGIYKLWRMYVAAHAAGQAFDAGYYARNNFFPWGSVGLWLVTVGLWVIAFGPLLATLVWAARRGGDRAERIRWALFFAGLLATMVFAYDAHRFANYVFVPLLLASLRFLDGSARARRWFLGLLLGSIASYLVFARPGVIGDRVYADINGVLFECLSHAVVEAQQAAGPGADASAVRVDFGAVLVGWIARVWPQLAALLAGLGAIVALGFWLPSGNAAAVPAGDGAGTGRAAADEAISAVPATTPPRPPAG